MKIFKRGIAAAIFLLSLMVPFAAEAEIVTVTGEGSYIVGDGPGETVREGKERARAEALRSATEKAGVYVESYTVTKNGELTQDEIHMIAASLLHVESVELHPETEGESIRFVCQLRATLDTDSIDLERLMKEKQTEEKAAKDEAEVRTLRDEVARLEAILARQKSGEAQLLAEQGGTSTAGDAETGPASPLWKTVGTLSIDINHIDRVGDGSTVRIPAKLYRKTRNRFSHESVTYYVTFPGENCYVKYADGRAEPVTDIAPKEGEDPAFSMLKEEAEKAYKMG